MKVFVTLRRCVSHVQVSHVCVEQQKVLECICVGMCHISNKVYMFVGVTYSISVTRMCGAANGFGV